jgi:hypothetical protein
MEFYAPVFQVVEHGLSGRASCGLRYRNYRRRHWQDSRNFPKILLPVIHEAPDIPPPEVRVYYPALIGGNLLLRLVAPSLLLPHLT